MQDMGMPDYCLDIHTLQTTSLIETFASMVANGATIQSRLRAACVGHAAALQRQYDDVWTRVVGQPHGRTD